jgi:hypothetical protein
MEFDVFVKLIESAQTARDGYLLLDRAEKEGTPELIEWLRTCSVRWALVTNQHLREVMFLAQYPKWNNQDMVRYLTLCEFNDNELLDQAEARGLDVTKWSGQLCVAAMSYSTTIEWLNRRIDVRSRVSPISLHSPFWYEPLEEPESTLESLAMINYPEPMANVARHMKCLSVYYVKDTIMEFIKREHCLANNGALLRVLMKEKRSRRGMRKMLATHLKLTPSDFASAGLPATE